MTKFPDQHYRQDTDRVDVTELALKLGATWPEILELEAAGKLRRTDEFGTAWERAGMLKLLNEK